MQQQRQVVDVGDLMKAIMGKDEATVSQWLCLVRNADTGATGAAMSKACDAILGTLIRIYCARFLTRSVGHVEHFGALVQACCDLTVDRNRRYQRVANVCAYLTNNPCKQDCIHVYPALATPLPELSTEGQEIPPEKKNKVVSARKLAKAYRGFVDARAAVIREAHGQVVADCTRAWLAQGEQVVPAEHVDTLCLLEHCIMQKDAKASHRVCTYLVSACPDLRSTTLQDVFECLWKVLLLCLDAIQPAMDVLRYVRCCRDLYFTCLPQKRKARECRLALLYYAIIVICDGRTRGAHEDTPVTFAAINLPVTFDASMQYLTVFPRLP